MSNISTTMPLGRVVGMTIHYWYVPYMYFTIYQLNYLNKQSFIRQVIQLPLALLSQQVSVGGRMYLYV